jgi:hypothetical protein
MDTPRHGGINYTGDITGSTVRRINICWLVGISLFNAYLYSMIQLPIDAIAQETSSQQIEERLKLEENARIILEQLAVPGGKYQAPAERLLSILPEATSISRGPGKPLPSNTKERVRFNTDQLIAVARADTNFPHTKGFECLDAHSKCELRGHTWLDCQLAMIVCMFSDLNK